MKSIIIHNWRKVGAVVNLPGLASLPKLLQECSNDSSRRSQDTGTVSKEQQASVASVEVRVRDSTGQKWHPWEGPNMTRLITHLLNKISMVPKSFGKIFCGLLRQKLNFLEGLCPISYIIIKRTSYQQSWWWRCEGLGCFAASGPGRLVHNLMHLRYAARQWSDSYQLVHLWKAKK